MNLISLQAWYLQTINRSLIMIPVLFVVFLLRFALKKSPKRFSYALWAVVGIRLLFDINIKSVLSVFNLGLVKQGMTQAQTAANQLLTAPTASSTLNMAQTANATPIEAVEQVQQGFQLAQLLPILWAMGAITFIAVTAVQTLRLRKEISTAIHVHDNIWVSDRIATPFVLGILRPQIYLPLGMNDAQKVYVLAHEEHHLRRGDHLWKLIGMLLLAVHWFNPFAWLAFRAFERDMELSCDEAVLERLGTEHSKDYSRTLLSLAANRRDFAPTLAFGAPDAKTRIQNALNFREPKKMVLLVSLVAVAIAAVVCGTGQLVHTTGTIKCEGRGWLVPDGDSKLNQAYHYQWTFPDDAQKAIVYEIETVDDISMKYIQPKEFFCSWDSNGAQFTQTEADAQNSIHWEVAGTGEPIDIRKGGMSIRNVADLGDIETKIAIQMDGDSAAAHVKTIPTRANTAGYHASPQEIKLNTPVELMFYTAFDENGNEHHYKIMMLVTDDVRTQLEVSDISDRVARFYDSRVLYVGNNSAVSNLANIITENNQFNAYRLELQTKAEPYGVTLYFTSTDGNEATESMEKAFYAEGYQNAALMLALIDNAEVYSQTLNGGEPFALTVADVEKAYSIENLKGYGASMEQLQILYNLVMYRPVTELVSATTEATEQAEFTLVWNAEEARKDYDAAARQLLQLAFGIEVSENEAIVSSTSHGEEYQYQCLDSRCLVTFDDGDYPQYVGWSVASVEEEQTEIDSTEDSFKPEAIQTAKDFVWNLYGVDCSNAEVKAFRYLDGVVVAFSVSDQENFAVSFYYHNLEAPRGIHFYTEKDGMLQSVKGKFDVKEYDLTQYETTVKS